MAEVATEPAWLSERRQQGRLSRAEPAPPRPEGEGLGIHRPLRARARLLRGRPTPRPTIERRRGRDACCRWPRRVESPRRAARGAARLAGPGRGPLRRPQRGGLARRRARPRARAASGSTEPIRIEVPLDARRRRGRLAHPDRARGGRRGRGLGALVLARRRGRRAAQLGGRAAASARRATLRYVSTQDISEKAWIFATQRAEVERDGRLDWAALGFGSARGKVRMETKLAGPGSEARVTGGYAGGARPAPRLRHDPGARGAEHQLRPRLPRRPRRRLDRGLARDDQGRPRRPADRRLPGEPQPAALHRGPRRRDPRPRDRRRRRPLHPRRGDRPGRHASSSST